ncbi:PREDICTED: uncharacterized protein LOC109221044 [Nicotiana attenuata]|uniref:Uncharacterized protein n=1 Tax=Nicotiana attenuata TaxID=49451 RepID=A0A1J6K3X0_NICAT|nr:PREDICTED: uncharacterized protein LOC109221044 [Nicotiana attenuata]OIT19776.1 hypothetical protein A4A49_41193 [Nicotiana attenuata]
MFYIFFGWRKATKCKDLIKRVKCRLKLLKNKRSCIIRQLRDDLGELLRHGHYQIVFDRVEQLYMDDNMLVVYELLENFCDFILMNLSYIRRHKDCPNDIKEAVSSLIFVSARIGDLPELLVIRKLFGERYGKKFETSALELLPGNLVNHQLKENMCRKSASNEVKYRLVDEIARTCFRRGPLLLEYRNESQHEMVINEQEKVSNSARSSVSFQSAISSPEPVKKTDSWKTNSFTLGQKRERRDIESSAQLDKEMIYLDDIEEFETILNFQDQRLFIFKGPLFPLMLKIDTDWNMNIFPAQKPRFVAIKDASVKDQECCSFTFSLSSEMTDLRSRNENQQPYLRTITMPTERPKHNLANNFLRSNSFPFQESGKGSPMNSHVHPKLPDYDELAAKFIALKKDKLQKNLIALPPE